MTKDTNTESVDKHEDDGETKATVIRTQTTETEELTEGLNFESPQKPLEDALEKQREEEKQMFDKLIQENVRIEREKRKTDEKLQEANAQNAVLTVEVDKHKEEIRELQFKISNMESEMRKRQGKKQEEDCEDEEEQSNKQRVRDLQFRLLRMTTDMEEMEAKMEKLEDERDEKHRLVTELEKCVDQSRVDEIHHQLAEEKRGGSHAEKDNRRANVVRQGGAVKSSVCVLM